MTVLQQIQEKKIIAIIRGVSSKDILETAKALIAGGIRLMEITFDHTSEDGMRNTLECFDILRSELGDEILMGAGTVLTAEEVELACQHGAKYIISPNTDEAVIRRTKELGLVSMPGALTPSEVVQAKNYGADIVKLFPAGDLGMGYIKSVKAPLAHISMAAVGGVNENNIGDFAKIGVDGFGIGSNLVNAKAVAAGNFNGITETAKKLVDNLHKALC